MPKPSVECYSGYAYAQEPRAVTWQGRHYPVACIMARWRTPSGPAFRVQTEPGEVFDLSYRENRDRWEVRLVPDSDGPDDEPRSAGLADFEPASGASDNTTGSPRPTSDVNTGLGGP